MPRALITGITGQDGLYLAELLLAKGYEVYGLIRGQNNPKRELVEQVVPDVKLLTGDLTDLSSLIRALSRRPSPTRSTTSARSRSSRTRGRTPGSPPRSPASACSTCSRPSGCYSGDDIGQGPLLPGLSLGDVRQGAGGAAARDDPALAALAVRRGQGLRALHDDQLPRVLRHARLLRHPVQPRVAAPRTGVRHPQDQPGGGRGSRSACRTASSLGNLDAKRDWGFAGDYVEAHVAHAAAARRPTTTCVATGETHSIRDLLDVAFARVGIDDWSRLRAPGPALHAPGRGRPARSVTPSKARDAAGLGARRSPSPSWSTMMVDADLAEQQALSSAGR